MIFRRKHISEAIAQYATKADWKALSSDVKNKLKDHVLDSLGCALGALDSDPIRAIRSEQQRT